METAKPSKLERSSQAGTKYYVVKGKDLLNGMDLSEKQKHLPELRSLSNEDNWREP